MVSRYLSASVSAIIAAAGIHGPALAQATNPPVSPPETVAEADKPDAPARAVASVVSSRQDDAGTTDDPSADIEVTGSRLSNGDPTTHVIVIDRKQIDRSGVTSVDDLIRTLPQNLATIGPITNSRTKGPLVDRRAPVSAIGSLGVSAANLGGIGAGNTLILVNGRRLAGAAGIEDGFVNLNGIPLAAVERVEISQNGASAVYGADAMGGVINFILRKNYTGFSLTGQYENSNNGANRVRANAYLGKSWSSGNMSLTVDYARTDPIVNAKTGYVTENYSSRFGGDPQFDFRSFDRGLQPGVINTSTDAYDPDTGVYTTIVSGLTPRAGVTGRPTIADFVTIGKDAARDYITRYAGPKSESISATFNFEQSITAKLKVFGNALVNRTGNFQTQDLNLGLGVTLAPGQYYNPFPIYAFSPYAPGVDVNYFPAAEIADGTLTAGRLKNVALSWSANAGISYAFNKDTTLSLIYTASRATTKGSGTTLGSVVGLQADPTAPNGVSCYNFDLGEGRGLLKPALRAALQAAFDRQCAALTSADPNVAFNPFRSATTGGGGSVKDFVYENDVENLGSRLQLIEARLNGSLLSLPAGKIRYALGGEYATDGVRSDVINLLTGTAQSRDRYAFFGEVNLPIFGGGFTAPLMNALLFNIAGRRDTYETRGAIGTVNNLPIEQGGALLFRKSTFERFTPAWGFEWQPVPAISIQGRWTRGFKAPPYTQLFSPAGTTSYSTTIVDDPYYSCIGCSRNFPDRNAYDVREVIAPNPDLKPQTSHQESFTFRLNPRGAWDRLSLAVTYNHTRLFNEYASPRDLQALLTQAQILSIPLFFPRDASGRVIESRNLTYNIVGSDYKSLTYELRYNFATPIGQVEPALIVVQNIRASRQALPDSPSIDPIGTIGGPDRYRINGQVSLTHGNWSGTLLGYYTPSYVNDYLAGRAAGVILNPELLQRVSPYATFDLTAAWQPTRHARLSFAARNILDGAPPFTLVDKRPYDTARYNVAGRTLSLQLSYSF